MKKILAVFLAIVMTISMVPMVHAEAPTTEAEYPIIFVTGIGQTWMHLLDENGNYVTEKDGSVLDYNIFYMDVSVLKQPAVLVKAVKVVGELVLSLAMGHNFVTKKDAGALLAALLNKNLVNEKGELPPDVADCIKPYPVSEYDELELYDFYYSIPCQFMVEQVGADNVYCFNHSAFSFLYKDADELDAFIQKVLEQRGVDKVVLVPMSMGAAVTNAYLSRYGEKNQVKRVVSIVGAWYGSDILGDLMMLDYADNAPELLYNGLIADLVGKPAGFYVNIALRIFPKRVLRGIIDSVLGGMVESFLVKTPSMISVSPYTYYEAMEKQYLMKPELEYIRTQTREYYEAQKNLESRLHHLEDDLGMEFYFIGGYGLTYGEISGDVFGLFSFMKSNETTNSDEIVPVYSAAPGATYARVGEKLPKSGKYVSPDGSVDLSTSFAPDRTWMFYRQKHELEYNNTALRLAFDISTGKVTGVEQSKDLYPQFNESRDVQVLVRESRSILIPLEQFVQDNKNDPAKAAEVAKAQTMIDECNAMLNRTVNDREADDAVIEKTQALLVELGIKDAPKAQSKGEKFLYDFSEKLNDTVYKIFGAKGFADFRLFKK